VLDDPFCPDFVADRKTKRYSAQQKATIERVGLQFGINRFERLRDVVVPANRDVELGFGRPSCVVPGGEISGEP